MATEQDPRSIKLRINPFFFAACLLALATPSSRGQAAATATLTEPADAPYVPTMTFDVASVRENKDFDVHTRFTMSGHFVRHSTTYRATNWPIESVITEAYGIDRYQIVGAPDWPWPTFFMIEAKGDSDADARLAALTEKQQSAEQQHMLQGLLEERFKLKAHFETRQGDTYNLVVAKHGPKLGAAGSMPPSADELKRAGNYPVQALSQQGCNGQGCNYIAHSCDIGRLVRVLTITFGRPVTDQTGLTAKYDFVLKYQGRWDSERPADDLNPTPPMDRALEEQLGLKVEPAKGPIKVLVIDHIEKPSAN